MLYKTLNNNADSLVDRQYRSKPQLLVFLLVTPISILSKSLAMW